MEDPKHPEDGLLEDDLEFDAMYDYDEAEEAEDWTDDDFEEEWEAEAREHLGDYDPTLEGDR